MDWKEIEIEKFERKADYTRKAEKIRSKKTEKTERWNKNSKIKRKNQK